MLRFIKGKFDTYTKILKVLGINIEPTMDLPNSSNITNTIDLEGFHNIFILSRFH